MTWLKRRAVRRGVRWAAVGVAALCLGACSRPVALAPGQKVAGELGRGERVEYRLDLDAESYARLRAAPEPTEGTERAGSGDEITVRVLAPGDRPLIEVAGVRDADGGLIAWVAETAGRYRIELENGGPLGATAYRLEVEAARPARAGDRHRAAAETTRAEAERLSVAADREQVLAALERSLQQWRLASETDAAVGILIDMVDFDWQADPETALVRCEEALALSAATGLAGRRIDALNRKGRILRRRGDCDGALAAYELARRAAREGDDLGRAAVTEFNQAVLKKRCWPETAAAAFEDTIVLARRLGDAGSEALARRELSTIARQKGDLTAASFHLETAWRLAKRSEDSEAKAAIAQELGNLNRRRGRLVEALDDYRRCLELNERLGHREHLADVLLSLGALALELRRPEEAWAWDQRALRAAESMGDPGRQSAALVELGAVLRRQGDYLRAQEFFQRALAVARHIGSGPARARSIAAARFRLGNLLLALDRPREAVVELSAAREIQRSGGDDRGEAMTLRDLGAALGRLGEGARAVEHLDAALALNRQHGDLMGTAWTLHSLASLQAGTDPHRARETVEAAIAMMQRVRSGLAVDAFRAGFSDGPYRLYDLYIDLLVRSGDYEAAFVASEEARARSLLDLLEEARVDPRDGVDPELGREARAIDQRIEWLRHQLRDAVILDPAGDSVAFLRERVEEEIEAGWRMEAAIRQRSSRYRDLKAPSICTVSDVQALLAPGTGLIEYWLGDDGSYLFVITRTTFNVLVLPPLGALQPRLERLRATVVDRKPPEAFAREAYPLYLALVEPALRAAPDLVQLLIVADGPLHLLPFEALVTAPLAAGGRFESLDYLINRVSISYAPSATVLAKLIGDTGAARPSHPRRLRFLAFADPSYESTYPVDCPQPAAGRDDGGTEERGVEMRAFEPLIGARWEVEAIAARYGARARVYQGAHATEEAVTSNPDLARAERIHFAVHGFVCDHWPERAGLVLALDDDPREDGILETREIFRLHLTADLVVLSGCQTGLGRLVRGEGLIGLTRAFFYAGTPSLVASLWEVSDQSTVHLMSSFYAALDRGDDKAVALRRAKCDLLRQGGRTAAPFYWAPFVLLGSR